MAQKTRASSTTSILSFLPAPFIHLSFSHQPGIAPHTFPVMLSDAFFFFFHLIYVLTLSHQTTGLPSAFSARKDCCAGPARLALRAEAARGKISSAALETGRRVGGEVGSEKTQMERGKVHPVDGGLRSPGAWRGGDAA